ncbi:MAG: methyltransferase domain-containing protein [Candidatus Omnitrophota bacterium]
MQTSGRTLDYAAGVYDFLSPLMTFGQEGRLGRKAIGLLGLKARNKVLDIGCGTGTLSIEIAGLMPANPDSLAVGLDAAPKMIERARQKARGLRNIRFDVAIAESLPYPDGYFDCAVSTFFFHHINFGLKRKSLAEIWRVLKKDGELVIVDAARPYNLWGRLCAWSGYFLFKQEEIKENILGKLEEAFGLSPFRSWHKVSSHLGYVSVFKLVK